MPLQLSPSLKEKSKYWIAIGTNIHTTVIANQYAICTNTDIMALGQDAKSFLAQVLMSHIVVKTEGQPRCSILQRSSRRGSALAQNGPLGKPEPRDVS